MAALVRNVIEHGPYGDDPGFGAPFALNYGWASTGNDLNLWILALLGRFTSDAFTVMSLYFFVCFPLAGLTMYWLCRQYRLARPAAVLAGVLFAVIPGHQDRFAHLFLSAYWTVPFAAWLIIETAHGRSVLHRPRADSTTRPWSRLVLPVLLLLAIGLSDVYYVAFTLVIAVPIILIRLVRVPSWRELGRLALPVGIMVTPTLVSIAAARMRASRDALTGGVPFSRSFLDSHYWAGEIVDLVLPWPGHRVAPLGELTQGVDALTSTTGEVSSLGIVAVLGVAGVLVATGAAILRGQLSRLDPLIGALAVATVLAFGFYTRGGLGEVTSLLVTAQIRTWSRMFLFIALFGLLGMGRYITGLGRRPERGRTDLALLSTVLLVVGVLDQTNPGRAPDYAANRQYVEALARFDDTLESRLGANCPMFVLPVVGYPEVADELVTPMLFLGLASHNLRWSFGAIKGTDKADWQLGLPQQDPSRFLDDVASLGYCGVAIHEGLRERSPTLAARLPDLLGPVVATAPRAGFTAYDLRPWRRDLASRVGPAGVQALSRASLDPVVASLGGVWTLEGGDEVRSYPLGPGPTINVANLGVKGVSLTVRLAVVGSADATTRVQLAGGASSQPVVLGPRETGYLEASVVVPPGGTTIRVEATKPPGGWDAYSDPLRRSLLPAARSLEIEAADPTVNVGVDLPVR